MHNVYQKKQSNQIVLWGIILFGIVEIGLIYFALPSYYTHFMLFIPLYFLILGISLLLILSRMSRKKIHPGRALARLMIFNVAQMTLSFFILVLIYYCLPLEKQLKNIIVLAFGVYYIFFMGLKLFVLYNIDKQHKIAKKAKIK